MCDVQDLLPSLSKDMCSIYFLFRCFKGVSDVVEEECDYCQKSFNVSGREFQQHVKECFERHTERLNRRPQEVGDVGDDDDTQTL